MTGVPEGERLARAALSRMVEPGDPRVADVVEQLGPQEVHDQLRARLEMDGLGADVNPRLDGLDPAADLQRAEQMGLRFVVPGDDEWPSQLNDLAAIDPLNGQGGVPLGLWVRGPARLDELAGSVAVVGSRSATDYGETVAALIGARTAVTGRFVVSGAAAGIDQAAHRGALAGPADGACRTIAVLACSADRAYPPSNRALIEHIALHGAVVSEVPPGSAPLRHRFLSRNRLIAALTSATVVVEAAIRSGALNTANWAERLSRPVMGVPGPVTSAPSEGVHQLIRGGGATLVTGPEDVLELVGAAGEHLVDVPRAPARLRDALSPRAQRVLEAVPMIAAAGDLSIARTAGVALDEVRACLADLFERRLVERADHGWRLTPLAAE